MAFAPLFDPTQQFMARSGAPLAGGLLYVYRNTSQELATIKNVAGTNIANPVSLDADGRASGGVFVSDASTYTLVVNDAFEATQWTIVGMSPLGSDTSAVQSDWNETDQTKPDFIKNKPDLSLKEDVANKATDTIDPTSTTQYPSSKAMADFTNSAVSTNTGKYISDNGKPFLSASDLPTDPSIVSNNDYAVVLTNGIYYRYKATVVGTTVSWAMEYAINTNAFTPAQQAAIDSTVTAVKVGNYDSHIADTTIHVTQADKNEWNGKQDKPGSATENNIAVFNSSKSTKDSGKSFLPSTSTWDGTSDNLVPTAKSVQVQLNGKLTDSPRVSQRAPTADEKTGGMTDAYYKVAYDTDKTVFMDVTDNRSGLWARRSNSIGDWLVWMDNNGDGHLNGTSTKAQGYEAGGGIDLALQGKQATCMFRVETPEWNDLVESGFYEVRSSSPAGTNHSPEGGLIKCIVAKAVNASNQTGVSQIAMGDYVYTRFKPSSSSTWSDWKVMPYSNKFTAADSGKMVGIDANGLLSNTGVRTSEALKAVNYNRVHVEAMRGLGGSRLATYYNVGLYRYDGGTSVLVPTQIGSLNVGELVGGAEAIVKYSRQDWTPTSYNCEDFLVVNAGVDSEKLYDALQLGVLLSDTSCRRFTLRLANISDKDWHIMICHTFGNGYEGVYIPESKAYDSSKYSGNFTPIINQLVRAEKYYDVLIRPDKCVKVDIMISSMVYNSTSGLMAVIDTDEPYDPA